MFIPRRMFVERSPSRRAGHAFCHKPPAQSTRLTTRSGGAVKVDSGPVMNSPRIGDSDEIDIRPWSPPHQPGGRIAVPSRVGPLPRSWAFKKAERPARIHSHPPAGEIAPVSLKTHCHVVLRRARPRVPVPPSMNRDVNRAREVRIVVDLAIGAASGGDGW